MSYEDVKAACQAAAILDSHNVIISGTEMTTSNDPWYRLLNELVEWKKKQ